MKKTPPPPPPPGIISGSSKVKFIVKSKGSKWDLSQAANIISVAVILLISSLPVLLLYLELYKNFNGRFKL
jgi:hypothetical protein